MKKIAILLGVSDYLTVNKLPACKNDTLLMKQLLDSVNEYSDTLVISDSDSSSKIKQRIVSFLKKFEGEKIEQLFFYYTGHGDFDGKNFYYILGDYDKAKYKQTTIENSELDNWIRLLKPSITVKVIDACHAGIQYIKDPEAFEKYLTTTPKSLSSCYFMFSSQSDEYSWQNQELSYFTKCFVESISEFQGSEIRFKDIIDYISDNFETVDNQTPYFITQATNTEIFANVDSKVREQVKKSLQSFITLKVKPKDSKDLAELSLVQLIQMDAQNYFSEEEMVKRINLINEIFSNIKLTGDIGELYSFESEALSDLNSELPKADEIGKWISESKNNYFAEPTYKTIEYDKEVVVPKEGALPPSARWLSIIRAFANPEDFETKTVTRTKEVVDGYKTTYNSEYSAFRITAVPKYENLNWLECHIAFIISKTEIRFFYIISKLKELNWQERKSLEKGSWKLEQCEVKDENSIKTICESIISEFKDYILTPIKAKFCGDSEECNTEEVDIDLEEKENNSQQSV